MNGELKACPFDGADARLIRHGDTKRFSIRCCKCGADVGECNTEAEVREAWNRRPTLAPGALPELPEAKWFLGPGGDNPLFSTDQMHAYARSYAEQCRAGVVVTDAMVERACETMWPDFWESHGNTHDLKIARRKYMRAALQSAFADDEGVKRG